MYEVADLSAILKAVVPQPKLGAQAQAAAQKAKADAAKATALDDPPEVIRTDDKVISIPHGMSPKQVVDWAHEWATEEQTVVAVREEIRGVPIDAAYALQAVIKREFGASSAKATFSLFAGKQPPKYVSVPIDANGSTVNVFIGKLALAAFEGGEISTAPNDDGTSLFVIGNIKKRDVPMFNKLIALTREFLAEHSLYRGKALILGDSAENMQIPRLWDVTGFQPVILNSDTRNVVDACLLTPMRHADALRNEGIPVGRKVLFHGTYGTGKTLLARLAAQEAVSAGFTFIYATDVTHLPAILAWSELLAPVCVFMEDSERVVDSYEDIAKAQLALDGIDTKTREVIVVMTTNHVDKLPPGLTRPGRLDTVIEIGLPNDDSIARLVDLYGRGSLDPATNWPSLVAELRGLTPAVICEVVKRAKLFAITRASGRLPVNINHEDVILAATGMKHHIMLSSKAVVMPKTPMEQIGSAFGAVMFEGFKDYFADRYGYRANDPEVVEDAKQHVEAVEATIARIAKG